jgi:F0F1-type ATP synthase beta subunit
VWAIATRKEALWTPGQEVTDTGEPFTEAIDLDVALRAVEALSPAREAGGLECGIKTIDVFAPLSRDGSTGIFAEYGVGVLVLIPELVHRLDGEDRRQTFFIFNMPMRDARQWREVIPEITPGNRRIRICHIPLADPLNESVVAAFQGMDARLVLSRRLAEQAIWPCIDPHLSSSRRLESGQVGPEQARVATETRDLLRDYYALQFSSGEASRRALRPEEWQRIQRARRALRFLSQPFYVAEPYTSRPGIAVPAADAVRGFAEILAGRHDSTPADSLYMVGAIPSQRGNTP